MPTDADSYTESVAGAVRAELARKRRPFIDVAKILDVSRATAYRRINGEEPYDVAELELIAKDLGISVQVFFDSAEGARARQAVA